MSAIPFQIIDWQSMAPTQQTGDSGVATAQTLQLEGLRIRRVNYSAGYQADHWCRKGHILHCLKGTLTTEMENGEHFILEAGMTYIVSDDLSSHRSVCTAPVELLIIDGDFLN
jgi:quercetin dioxygenase-like cupin family protein